MRRALNLPIALGVAVGVLAGCASPMASPRSTPTASASSAAPTTTAAMVCGAEIKGKVQEVLKLQSPPTTRSTFAANLFTCAYRLPLGPMRLSVQHSPTKATATAYLQGRRKAVGANEPAPGLGEAGYANGSGVVLVIKDNETLEVDTTGLPTVFGPEGQKRTDLGYEIASDVLGCWTGDDES